MRKNNITRFKEKVNRIFFALRRYKKQHTPEEFSEQIRSVFKTTLEGVNFYRALDLQEFKGKSQYKYMKNLLKKTAKRLNYNDELFLD